MSSKLCQTSNPYGVVTPTEFVFMTGAIRFVLCSITLLVSNHEESKKEHGEKLEFRNVLPIILCSAVVSGVSYMLQLIGRQIYRLRCCIRLYQADALYSQQL